MQGPYGLFLVTQRGLPSVRDELFQSYRTVGQRLPASYVDYALSYLFEPATSSRSRKPRRVETDEGFDFFPPSFLKGPFLFLLRTHEEEGLRLVHGVVNEATRIWLASTREPRRPNFSGILTPLPTIIALSNGPREFWGNEGVYLWFRSHGFGSYTVTSALMALEFWMEEQINTGRPVEELFAAALESSICVAVPGICLGIALAHLGQPDEERYLKAALPMMCSPQIWRLDISRQVHDPKRPLTRVWDDDEIQKLETEREQRPQRSIYVRDAAMSYGLRANEDIWAPFSREVGRFPRNLPFLFEEERTSGTTTYLREVAEKHALAADRANYYCRQLEDGRFVIGIEVPTAIQERDKPEAERMARYAEVLTLHNWMHKALENEAVLAGEMSVEAALEMAQRFWHEGDFDSPGEGGDYIRRQSIVGAVIAALVLNYDETKSNGHLPWCRNVLLRAAGPSEQPYIWPPKHAPARGLGVFLARGESDNEIPHTLLQLAASPNSEITRGVFWGLHDVWSLDPVLCWNALLLTLRVALEERQSGLRILSMADEQRTEEYRQRQKYGRQVALEYQEFLRKGELPPLLQAPFEKFGMHKDLVESALGNVPIEQLVANAEDCERLLQIADELMRWTLARNTPFPNTARSSFNEPHHWNRFFIGWMVRLTKWLSHDEIRLHLFDPLRQIWATAPQLTEQLLFGYIRHRIGRVEPLSPEAVAQWKEISFGVLKLIREQQVAPDNRHSVDSVFPLVIWSGDSSYFMPEEWPHALLFADVMAKWIEVARSNPYHYPALLNALERFGNAWMPEHALEWLCAYIERPLQAGATMREFFDPPHYSLGRQSSDENSVNGHRTARLLNRIWGAHAEAIRAHSITLERYTRLVETLVSAGVPLAGQLQAKLERTEV